jgi:hypothetical protein
MIQRGIDLGCVHISPIWVINIEPTILIMSCPARIVFISMIGLVELKTRRKVLG